MLYEKSNKIGSDRIYANMDSVQHLHIHTRNAIEQFMGTFPNTTELTISKNFTISHDSIATDLDRIISLKHLTKLTFDCLRLSLEHLLELLSLMPYLTILKLDAILLHRSNPITIQQSDIFQLVSSNNIVSNLTIEQEITLEKTQLVTAIFPRLESLTINLYRQHLEPITRSLLTKPNNNTRCLSTLCITKHRRVIFLNFQRLLQTENLLTDYSLKFINQKTYLWW